MKEKVRGWGRKKHLSVEKVISHNLNMSFLPHVHHLHPCEAFFVSAADDNLTAEERALSLNKQKYPLHNFLAWSSK